MWRACRKLTRDALIILGITALLLIPCDWLLRRVLPPVHTATRYGWNPPENITLHPVVEDSPGNSRELTVQYFGNGFKRWGNVDTGKTRVLIVGDSFTEMNWVSNGEEWYSWLEREFPNAELFVFGAGGYGTLQEFMVIDDYLDRIKPDLIVLQFCGNDFQNNLYRYDLATFPFNNHGPRPYLEGDEIVWRLPLPFAGLRTYSFAADRLLGIYDEVAWRRATENLEAYKRENQKYLRSLPQIFEADSTAVTHKILNRLKKRAGDIPIHVMSNNNDGEAISRGHGFPFISMKEIDEREKQGQSVKIPNNGHWNRLGNRLAGERMVEFLRPALTQTHARTGRESGTPGVAAGSP